MSDSSIDWIINIIKIKIQIFNLSDKYTHWLIFKFTLIAKKAKLISECLSKIIIGDSMIFQEKEILTRILYN